MKQYLYLILLIIPFKPCWANSKCSTFTISKASAQLDGGSVKIEAAMNCTPLLIEIKNQSGFDSGTKRISLNGKLMRAGGSMEKAILKGIHDWISDNSKDLPPSKIKELYLSDKNKQDDLNNIMASISFLELFCTTKSNYINNKSICKKYRIRQ